MTGLRTRFGRFLDWFKRNEKARSHNARGGKVRNLRDAAKSGATVADRELSELAQEVAVRPRKESPVEQLQRGYDKVVDMLDSVRTHMQEQDKRSQRLMTMLEGLPEALRSLPQATRNQTRTLEAIQANLEHQSQQNSQLAEALSGLARTTEHHEQAMAAIGQQLDVHQQTGEQMLGSFSTLTNTLGQMSHTSEASTNLLRRIAEQDGRAAEQVRQLFNRNQKHMTTMSVVSWSLAIVALTVAGFVAVSVGRMNANNATAAPGVTPTANDATAPADSGDAQPANTPASAAFAPTVSVPADPNTLLDDSADDADLRTPDSTTSPTTTNPTANDNASALPANTPAKRISQRTDAGAD